MKYLISIILLFSFDCYAYRTADIPVVVNGNMGLSTIPGSSTVGTPNIVSSAIFLDQMSVLSLQAVVGDSTAVGGFYIQFSNDMGEGPLGNGVLNWTTVSGSSTAVVGASSYIWNYPAIGYRWGRLIYSRTSGSGPLNVRASVKGN